MAERWQGYIIPEEGDGCPVCGSEVAYEFQCPACAARICKGCDNPLLYRCSNPACDWWYHDPRQNRGDERRMGTRPAWMDQAHAAEAVQIAPAGS